MPHPLVPNVFARTAHIDVGKLTHGLKKGFCHIDAGKLWSWAQIPTNDLLTAMHSPVGPCDPAKANTAESTHLSQTRLAVCTQEEADDGCAA